MIQPDPILLKLTKIGFINSITVKNVQTGTDTADTFVKIIGTSGSTEGLWRSYNKYLDVRVDYNSIARVKDQFWKEVEEWEKFAKKEQRDLSEYKRLKAKFEGGKSEA